MPIGNGNEVTGGNTQETLKDELQAKRTFFTERFAAMVRIRPNDKDETTTATSKSNTFGTVYAITTEAGKGRNKAPESWGKESHIIDRCMK